MRLIGMAVRESTIVGSIRSFTKNMGEFCGGYGGDRTETGRESRTGKVGKTERASDSATSHNQLSTLGFS